MSKKEVKVMITAFRDGFQSVYGARVFSKDFLPAVEAAKNAGISHFEAGGGATFQSPFFYTNENAFDVMDGFRKAAGPDANLQTLARGINVVGLDSQPRDIINLHAKLFKKHGITTIRNFDALNDVNNLVYSGQCIKDAGLKHEVVVTMMALPPGCEGAHDPDFYEKTLKAILDAGIPYDSVCFKDASGTTTPTVVYEAIKRARALLGNDIDLVFHSHETAGIGLLQYKAALDAGANRLDLSMAPASGGTCQTDVITMWHALRGTEYDLGLDVDKLRKAGEVFKECMKDYFMPPEAKAVEPLIPFSPMPGGALTANTQMMRDNGILDKYTDVIKAMSEVVIKGGFGTSVTPVSQFYFQQAFSNVMSGKWKKITEGYGKMVLGYFGKTPTSPDPEIVKIASEQLKLEPTTRSPIDINDEDPKKGIEAAKKLLTENGITDLSDENIFIAAACKEKGILFLKGGAQTNVRKNVAKTTTDSASGDNGYTVNVGKNTYDVVLDGDKATVNGKTYDVSIKEGLSGNTSKPVSADAEATIEAPMPGVIIKLNVSNGDSVSDGDVILIMEAMKMETEVKSHVNGTITDVKVKAGDQIQKGDALVHIG